MTAGMEQEHLTEDLLKRLLASTSIQSYLDEGETVDQTLVDFLNELLRREGINRSQLARRCGINTTVVYDIYEGKSRPGRDRAIMLALGLNCSLAETQRLLRLDGMAELWAKNRRDAVIIWCIDHGMDRPETDDELYRLGEKTLLGTGKLR